jgi:hypothetical protein
VGYFESEDVRASVAYLEFAKGAIAARPLLKLVRYTFGMNIDKILASIDSEIVQLKQARALLSGDGTKKAPSASPVRRKRKMSAAARKRIGDAQRKRWAKQRASK